MRDEENTFMAIFGAVVMVISTFLTAVFIVNGSYFAIIPFCFGIFGVIVCGKACAGDFY